MTLQNFDHEGRGLYKTVMTFEEIVHVTTLYEARD
jgi:hypothetical protein